MSLVRNALQPVKLNPQATLPFELRMEDFLLAVQDVYDFFFDVNTSLSVKGLERLDDTLRPAIWASKSKPRENPVGRSIRTARAINGCACLSMRLTTNRSPPPIAAQWRSTRFTSAR